MASAQDIHAMDFAGRLAPILSMLEKLMFCCWTGWLVAGWLVLVDW
jgi:hypothetical protein